MITSVQKLSQKAGLPPGTAVHVGERKSDKVTVSLFDYESETLRSLTVDNLEECLAYRNSSTVTWMHVDGLHDAKKIEEIGQLFDLHPLTIEDILNTSQRPKLDLFEKYIYLVIRVPFYDAIDKLIYLEQVSFILADNFLLTFQEQPDDTFDPVRERLRTSKGRLRTMGADYLTYTLIDTVIDSHFRVLEEISEDLETIEEELATQPSRETLSSIHSLKREMILLRKSVWPLRETINRMLRDDVPFIEERNRMFFQDLYDHTIQVLDTVETYRDLISGMLDIYLSVASNQMNEIMKMLTLYATIFIPLTFIAGLYGMNFNAEKSPYNMPELNWFYGYPFALGLMAAVGIGLLVYFKRKKWF